MQEQIAVLAEPDPDQSIFAEVLDKESLEELLVIEQQLAALKRHGSTVAGYPLIRPYDCGPITNALSGIFKGAKDRFRLADPSVVGHFEALISDFVDYVSAIYPNQATGALILHAKVLLFMGKADRVVALLEFFVRRPYAVVDSLDHCANIAWLYAKAHLMRGTPEEIGICFASFGAWLGAQPRGPRTGWIAKQIVPFAVVTSGSQHILARIIRWSSAVQLRSCREHHGAVPFVKAKLVAGICYLVAVACLRLLARKQKYGPPYQERRNTSKTTLVARAMGGIGDLLMMEPGLEALARKQGSPVDMAIPRKFFAVFANNPHVRTIDIEGPPIDLANYGRLANLSNCPASRYESRVRPNIRKSRVETFAGGMGIGPKLLRQQGWHINQFSDEQIAAKCDTFIASLGFERRLIGVQPFSRDSYKDYLQIGTVIRQLAERYDVLVFHHVADGLPEGPGIATTAGLPLATSLALVSRLDAMVSVDSAFLHAAAAYDIPVVALFGPTDARTLTSHHRNVEIVWQAESYSCVPCWRNEDSPCRLTGLLGVSPCLATIDPARVVRAVDRALGEA